MEDKKRYIDFDIEDFATKKGERIFYAIMLVTFLAVVSFIGYITLVTLTPYEPYHWYSYTPVQSEVCPGGPVQVYVDRWIDPEADVDSVQINGYWTNAETGDRVGDVSAYVGTDNTGEQVPSSAFKNAPNQEGDWHPTGYVIVEGELYGWHSTQSEEFLGDTAITVKEGEDC